HVGAVLRADRPVADSLPARRAPAAVLPPRRVHAQRGPRHRRAAAVARADAPGRRKRHRGRPAAIARVARRYAPPDPGRLPDAVLWPLRGRRRTGPLASPATGGDRGRVARSSELIASPSIDDRVRRPPRLGPRAHTTTYLCNCQRQHRLSAWPSPD